MDARAALTLALSASLAAFLVVVAACGDDAPPAGPPADIVGVLELPVSHRGGGPRPTNAVRIDVSPNELRVGSTSVLTLSTGSLPAGEAGANHVITKLRTAIQASGGHSAAELHMHASTPYETTVDILATLNAANIHTASFQVRRIQAPPPVAPGTKRPPIVGNAGTTTGWLELRNFVIVERGDEQVNIAGVEPLQWDDFVRNWEAIYTTCRGAQGADCVPTADVIAPGGIAQLILRSRGDGAKIDVVRYGADWDAGTPVAPRMMEGVPTPPQDPTLVPIPPATEAGFTMRQAETTDAQSVLLDMLRPICGSRACPVVVIADKETMTMRVLSLIGASFPDNSAAPTIAFVAPH